MCVCARPGRGGSPETKCSLLLLGYFTSYHINQFHNPSAHRHISPAAAMSTQEELINIREKETIRLHASLARNEADIEKYQRLLDEAITTEEKQIHQLSIDSCVELNAATRNLLETYRRHPPGLTLERVRRKAGQHVEYLAQQ